MSSKILLSLIVRPLLLSVGARHGSFPMYVEKHIRALLHPVRPGTSGMGMAWCRRRRAVLGVVSVSNPLLFPTFGSVVALVRYRLCSWIAGSMVVWICSRRFPLTAGIGLLRGPEVWVMLCLLPVLVCALNRRLPDCPRCRDCFDNSTTRCPSLTQSWRRLPILRFLWQDCAVSILPAISYSGYSFVGILLVLQPE